jgi:ATP-binding protein involved in chromosome partitioning
MERIESGGTGFVEFSEIMHFFHDPEIFSWMKALTFTPIFRMLQPGLRIKEEDAACPTQSIVRIRTRTARESMIEKGEKKRQNLVPGVTNPIAVASGKGGVGKSTVAVNLAYSLAAEGKKTGLFDSDIFGPNIPRMLGIEGEMPKAVKGKISTVQKDGLRVMSLGLIARPDQAVIWRGPMVSKAIEKMLADVTWGVLDYMVIDLPPGTGDAQLTLSQRLSLAGAVMVTTPQSVSQSDVRRGIEMFRNVSVPILGLIENMSYYTCPTCGTKEEIFPGAGVEGITRDYSIELLGKIPIDPGISVGGDSGKPVVLTDADGEIGMAFREIARSVIRLTANR